MKILIKSTCSILALTALTACASINESPTRTQTASLSFAAQSTEYSEITAQGESLNRMADALVRKSTGRGAAIGAAVGCGLGLVSKSSAQKCLTGAVAGGAVGAVVGNQHGKRKVAQRVEKVSREDVAGALREADTQLKEIKGALPKILARQDAELSELSRQKAAKTISAEDYDARVEAIRASRAQLADALMDSAEKARVSADNLGAAAAEGQSGLIWHIGAAKKLEEESISTRSTITLL